MVLRSLHRYVAEATDPRGDRLGELSLSPDLAPAAQWSHWQGVRCGALPAHAHHGPGLVEPVYDPTRGRPYVSGIRVRFEAADPAYESPVISWSYFQLDVETSAQRLVGDGTLRAGQTLAYRICAFPVHDDDPARAVAVDRAEGPGAPLTLERAALASCLAGAERMCEPAWNDDDFPVLVASTVLDEVTEVAIAAGESETGGILVGHLRRDCVSPEVYLEITAQIPAAGASAGRAHLRFTPATWAAVSDALALRRRDEVWLGWWHYHPFFCERCDPEQRRRCALSRPFFSREDCELHRAVFDTAFSVALLVSDLGEGSPRHDWFGWRHGVVAARGCYRVAPQGAAKPSVHGAGGIAPAARVLNVSEEDYEH